MKADLISTLFDYIGNNPRIRLAQLSTIYYILLDNNNNHANISYDLNIHWGNAAYTYIIETKRYIRKYGYFEEMQGHDAYMYEFKTRDKHLLLNFDRDGDGKDKFIYNGQKLNLEWEDVESIADIIEEFIVARRSLFDKN